MKRILEICLMVLAGTGVIVGQNPATPVPRPGISVQLPVSSRAVAMPEADQQDVTVVTVTADGDLYVGMQPANVGALADLRASNVYVKADARASYQQVLAVLLALKDHHLVLLTGATVKAGDGQLSPPYGIPVSVGMQ